MTVRNCMNIPLIGAGKFLIGSGASNFPSANTLTAGAGISITNSNGGATITNTATAQKIKYYDQTTPNTTIAASGALVSLTLPANTAAVGDLIEIGGEVVVARTATTFTGDVDIVAGSTTIAFFNGFSAGAGVSITYSFYAFLISSSSSNGFLASQCTGVTSGGTQQADAHLTTAAAVDFTNNATLGTALTITGGSGTATQRMLWIRVTGA